MLTMNYQRLIESGVDQWNQWRHQNPNQSPDLRGVDLTSSYLFEINLMGSDLRGADLRRACLIGADFSQANLSGANLGGAYLSEAKFREANLSNANLIDAHMANADLLQAILVGTCLEPVEHTVVRLPRTSTANELPAEQLPIQTSGQVAKEITKEIAKEITKETATKAGRETIQALKKIEEKQKEIYPKSQSLAAQAYRDLIKQCHHKLCDYYIGPMAKLILDDIITVKQPQTNCQFIKLVAAHIPIPQDALSFQHGFAKRSVPKSTPHPSLSSQISHKTRTLPNVQNSHKAQAYTQSARPSSNALTHACIKKCQQALAEYYIAPMAQMLIDDVLAMHQPKTARQFVQLIACHLPPDQIESFSRKVLA